jgi:transcription elongation factor Elf1
MKWEEAAKLCELVYGIFADYEERYFECPDCGEPLYEDDWFDWSFESCPVCGLNWEQEAEE